MIVVTRALISVTGWLVPVLASLWLWPTSTEDLILLPSAVSTRLPPVNWVRRHIATCWAPSASGTRSNSSTIVFTLIHHRVTNKYSFRYNKWQPPLSQDFDFQVIWWWTWKCRYCWSSLMDGANEINCFADGSWICSEFRSIQRSIPSADKTLKMKQLPESRNRFGFGRRCSDQTWNNRTQVHFPFTISRQSISW